MQLGKDFWFIVWLLKIIVEIFERIGKENNGDTPEGEI